MAKFNGLCPFDLITGDIRSSHNLFNKSIVLEYCSYSSLLVSMTNTSKSDSTVVKLELGHV